MDLNHLLHHPEPLFKLALLFLLFRAVIFAFSRSGNRRARLRTMPYRDYLRTPEWRSRRKWKLQQAGYRCQATACGSRTRLQVHHLTYARRGEEALSDLMVLCDDCHRQVHGIR
jgi:5-methylcytosine-specific restriction endonuclease McrA